MDVIIFVSLIILLLVLMSNQSSLIKRFDKTDRTAEKLEVKVTALMQEIASLKHPDALPLQNTVKPVSGESIQHSIAPPEEPVKEYKQYVPPVVKVPAPAPIKPKGEPAISIPPVQQLKTESIKKEVVPPKPSFMERNPDLEKFIGENLINKIGIGILVLGIGFFVKFAIDQDWINEIGRVSIGILCGGILIGIAHKLRNVFKAFSSVLVGGGLAVFYLTIAIAFHDYQIFSQTSAFIIMVVITGFAVLLSITYNRQELAILAIVGGFISPFIVSTGSGNYVVLFSYVLILNTGMIILAYFKRWNIVNIVSYVFTMLLYAGWLYSKVLSSSEEHPPYAGALLFASVFYVIFFVMNILNNIKENTKFVASEIMILVSNTFLYYSFGILILKNIDGGIYQGLFTAIVAVFNCVFAITLYKSQKADKNLIYLLIGMVLTFVSLAAPVQLEGNYITLFWATEAVLLLWFSQKAGIQLIKTSALIVSYLMLVSLIMDWAKLYSYDHELMNILLNKAFVTSVVSILSVFITSRLFKKETGLLFNTVEVTVYSTFLTVLCVILCYTALLLELNFQLQNRLANGDARTIYLAIYNFSFSFACIVYALKQKKELYLYGILILTTLSFIAYAIICHSPIIDLRDGYLTGLGRNGPVWFGHYYAHYLLSILLLGMIWFSSVLLKKYYPVSSKEYKPFLWISSFFIVVIFSSELQHVLISLFYKGGEMTAIDTISKHVFQIGFPILWGVCSFIAMYIGMRNKIKPYRIISLVLFSITLLKLFIFDVTKMSEGGKIAAFISLGILLLIISFMYQKLKKIIIEDEKQIH